MNSEGVLVFDVNDFDEAYLGHFTWDLRRFVASLALMGWQKALPEDDVRRLSRTYLDAYVDQVRHYVKVEEDEAFALRLDNTDGAVHEVLVTARMCTRVEMLDDTTEVVDHERRFARGAGVRELSKTERGKVERAFKRYLTTLSDSKRQQQAVFYDIKDVVGRAGFGIGSAGLPAYNILIEGFNQALENDVVLSMKQANVPAVEPDRRPRARGRASSRTRATARSSASASSRCTPTRSSAGPRWTRSGTSSPRCRRTRPTSTGVRSASPRRSSPSWSCSGGRPPRSTASPTRTATRTSSTSRPRRRSSRRSTTTPRRSSTSWSSSGSPTPRRPARTTPCSSTPSARASFDLVSAVS